MMVFGNFFIQDGDRPPFWIFIFAIHGLSYRKSKSEKYIKFGDSSYKGMKVVNLKIKNGGRPLCWILAYAVYSYAIGSQILKKTHQIW